MEFQSVTEMVNELRRRTRDGGDSKWSYLDKVEALRAAARNVQGKFTVEAVYTSLELDTVAYDYAIPAYIDKVISVERKWTEAISITGDSLVANEWQEIPWFEVRPTTQTNFLYVDQLYTAGDVRVWYQQDQPPLPPAQMTLAAAITPSQGSIAVGVGVNTLSVLDYPPQGYLKLTEGSKREVLYYEALTNTSFIGVQRGIWGVAASFNSAVVADPVLILDRGGAGFEYILSDAQAILYEWLLADGSTFDRSAEQFLARWRDQKTKELSTILNQHRRPGSIRIGKRGRF